MNAQLRTRFCSYTSACINIFSQVVTLRSQRIRSLSQKQLSFLLFSGKNEEANSVSRTLAPRVCLSRRSVSPVPRDFRFRNPGDVALKRHGAAFSRRDVIARILTNHRRRNCKQCSTRTALRWSFRKKDKFRQPLLGKSIDYLHEVFMKT